MLNPWEWALLALLFAWIAISVAKYFCNRDGIQRYRFVDRNTAGYYLLSVLSVVISLWILDSYLLALPVFVVGYTIHELLWYGAYIRITKDEAETTSNFYTWANIFNDFIDHEEVAAHDFSEGLFDGDFSISNEEALRKKYDTYFEYLKLEPGMKVLDIGCGNGHWASYLKDRGVGVVGITIDYSNYRICIRKGIEVILGDARRVLPGMEEKFDAVSAIGSVEHFASVSQPPAKRQNELLKYYKNVVAVIDGESASRRYLNSYMTINESYSGHGSLNWWWHFYLLPSVFGFGFYNRDEDMERIYSSFGSSIVKKRDLTEDYRYIFVRDRRYLGNFKWKYDSFGRKLALLKFMLTDPAWFQRVVVGWSNSWLWQFGGASAEPMPENRDTPVRAYVYVTELGGDEARCPAEPD